MQPERRDIVWQSLPGPALELLTVPQDDQAVRFQSVVIDAGPTPVPARYEIHTDAGWRVRRCHVRLLGAPEGQIVLQSDGNWNWTDGAGAALPALARCIDVDLTATPSTNTLPIRRLGLRPGHSTDIDVAWIQFPDLAFKRSLQRYTCLEQTVDGGRFRFLALDGGFTTDLPIDAGGFVLDYADRWTRLT